MQENHNLDIDREQEAHEYNSAQPFDLAVAKESIVPNTQAAIETLLQGVENGNINGLDVFATFKKLEKVFNEAKTMVEKYAIDEAEKHDKTFTFSGVTFTRVDGREALQFSEDHICKELEGKLAERKALVKVATKSKEQIFDSEGNEVMKVSSKHSKSSLSVKF